MSKLKTINIPGNSYFITITIVNRIRIFTQDVFCNIIINNLKFYRKKYKFKLLAYVIMPNHVHLIILPWFNELSSETGSSFGSEDASLVGSEEPTSTVRGLSANVDAGSSEPALNLTSELKEATISDIMRDFKKFTAIQIIKEFEKANNYKFLMNRLVSPKNIIQTQIANFKFGWTVFGR